MTQPTSDHEVPTELVAYLVVRFGSSLRDVYRLTPGQVTTVGRSPTNRIVITDEICSRNHCEVFQSDSEWTIRDLNSRNGTLVNGEQITGDWELEEGELIQIGRYQMGFTYDLSQPSRKYREKPREGDSETAFDLVFDDPPSDVEPAIIHRTRNTRYQSTDDTNTVGTDRVSRELASLYNLALEMGAAPTSQELSEVVLKGLFSGTSADIGAVLLLPQATSEEVDPATLEVIAYKAIGDGDYQQVSDFLSLTVLADREAILARDVADDSRLAGRDSLGEILARSVICAPIRVGTVVHGLIHLYSTDSDDPFDKNGLEFTLAVADQFAVALESLKEKEKLQAGLALVRNENQSLRRQLEIEGELIGDHPAIQQLREKIAKIADTGATALIRGESGVGKELVARAIHFSSSRRDRSFVCMNCAALSESLLESELFGHEKGAFTGADKLKLGKFEQADGGSLLLDEVGEMGLSLQAKFLRVLEGYPFERVGGSTPLQVDVRVIAATNRNLERAVQEGNFRKDLYFRLQVVELFAPSLRDHKSDIPLLANHFLRRFARKTERPVTNFSPQALEKLVGYGWPGNVRELQNTIERAVVLCSSSQINDSDIQLSSLEADPAQPDAPITDRSTREVSLEELEQKHILDTLEMTKWNKSRAAQILGIERSTLDRKLKRYQVARPKS